MPSPFVTLSFVYDFPLLYKISATALLVFGLVDLGIFLCYHDRINDMVIF